MSIDYRLRRLVFDGVTVAFLLSTLAMALLKPTDEFFKNLSLLFGGFLGFFVLGVLLSQVLNAKGLRTWGEVIFEPAHKKAKLQEDQKSKPLSDTFWRTHMVLVLFVTFAVAVLKTNFSLRELLDEDGMQGALRIFHQLLSPDWTVLPRAIVEIVETIFMAFLATALAIPFAFVLSFLSAKNLMRSPFSYFIYMALRTLMNVTRSIEALIWAIIFAVWVGIGPFAGMMALMIHSIASLTKQYSEIVESVNEGPIEGILSTGANRIQMIWFAIVPQVILPYISFTVYRWDINVRMATIIGLVGGGGIGAMLIQYSNQMLWQQVGCIVVVIAVVVWMMDQASAVIREALK